MNLIGKIFIVTILVMSVVFMAFALAVYATHRNYRDVVQNELNPKLKKEQEQNKALKDEMDRLKQQLKAETDAKTQAIAKLSNERDIALEEAKTLKAAEDKLNATQREAVSAMNATQTNATDYRKELESHRTAIEDARKDRDANFKEVMRLTDELNQAANEKDLLKKRTDELAKDMVKADQLLRKFNLDKNKDYSNVPPPVEGVITATPGAGLVEISIGADSGLIKGHKLEVYRLGGGQSTYVGRIEVVKTDPSRAVCKIDPKFQNSNMTVGDRVASKIE